MTEPTVSAWTCSTLRDAVILTVTLAGAAGDDPSVRNRAAERLLKWIAENHEKIDPATTSGTSAPTLQREQS